MVDWHSGFRYRPPHRPRMGAQLHPQFLAVLVLPAGCRSLRRLLPNERAVSPAGRRCSEWMVSWSRRIETTVMKNVISIGDQGAYITIKITTSWHLICARAECWVSVHRVVYVPFLQKSTDSCGQNDDRNVGNGVPNSQS
jgi:hypothetical protein